MLGGTHAAPQHPSFVFDRPLHSAHFTCDFFSPHIAKIPPFCQASRYNRHRNDAGMICVNSKIRLRA
jgi:hypothetical protein